ncbi:WXG100 family type VII secretion target [Mycolicibacterium novocastrense]|nr:WXG100 family type VII secretion target [Mycolicibacterium novocastrense]
MRTFTVRESWEGEAHCAPTMRRCRSEERQQVTRKPDLMDPASNLSVTVRREAKDMGMVGADIGQLRALARTLTQAADRLEGMTGEVNARLSSTPWQGQDALRFRSQWQDQSVIMMRGVVNALRAAASEVDRNANEQEEASAGSGDGVGGVGGGTVSPLPASAVSGWQPFPHLFNDPLAPFVNIRDFLGANALWPINNGLALGELVPELGPVLPLLDAIGLAGDTNLSPEDKIVEATRALTDLGGGFLKDAVPGQFGYLNGVAVSQWGDVAYEVSKADFSASTLQITGNYIASDPGGAFNAAKDAVLGYIPKLISNLWP